MKRKPNFLLACLAMLACFSARAASPAAAPATAAAQPVSAVGRILAAGHLRCGVITEPLDWNKVDLHGNLVGLEAAICHAVGTALFGRPDRVELRAFETEQLGLLALRHGDVDMVGGVTPSVAESAHAIHFSLPIFQDAQGFMVHRDSGIHSLADITGHKLCYIEDTDNDPTVLAYLAAHKVHPLPFGFQEEGEMDAAIMDLHCQVTSALISKLAEARATFHNSADYGFLPDLISLVPVTVATDSREARLSAIVDTTISLLLQAEDLGVTHSMALKLPHSEDPRLQRLSGEDFATAEALGLPHDWSRRVIAAMGNYAEMFDLTMGAHGRYHLDRGLNALWDKGGLMAPLPLH